jgi:hypothetical protein
VEVQPLTTNSFAGFTDATSKEGPATGWENAKPLIVGRISRAGVMYLVMVVLTALDG